MESLGGGGRQPRVQGHPQIPRVRGPSGLTEIPCLQSKTKKQDEIQEASTFRLQRSEVITSLAAVGVL